MIGPYLVLTFRWPWGLCWQLLVNFLHWGHSLTFYLSANYLTFSTYHLLFFKLLEAHPHFDTFLGKYSFFFACCWDVSLPTCCNIPFTEEINSLPNSRVKKHRGTENYEASFQFRKTECVYNKKQVVPEQTKVTIELYIWQLTKSTICRIYCRFFVLFLCQNFMYVSLINTSEII